MLDSTSDVSMPLFDTKSLPSIDTDFAAGAVFLIDKPFGWTSFRVVGLLRKLVNIKKVGHAGTLDPMATGLLILCTGKGTKQIHHYQDAVKSYRATITFGGATASYDKETEIIESAPFEHITREELESVLQRQFTGAIQQYPPMYSAVKHKGRPLYKIARQGGEVERKIRDVEVFEISVVDFRLPEVVIDITCSKGTYIRTIADDLGNALDSKAHLSGLIRTSIGEYALEDALSAETLIKQLDPDGKFGIYI